MAKARKASPTPAALDTESDSLYSYYPKGCLIQISTYADGQNPDPNQVIDYLIDRSGETGETFRSQPEV